MTAARIFYLLLLMTWLALPAAEAQGAVKKKIVVIDSYHREYQWSRDTNAGLQEALREFGYLDSRQQSIELTEKDYAESSRAVIRRLWMDTKRVKDKEAIAKITVEITAAIRGFNPDIILLGDDNAAHYIGNAFLDTPIPVVFWGVNNTPVKYGLVDSMEHPGHNVTGVYQKTYYAESLGFLKKLSPSARSFAVLTDDTTTGRIHAKAISYLARKGTLPLELAGTVSTSSSDEWRKQALDLQKNVDAFFIASSSGLTDSKGTSVSNRETAQWYLKNITIPEAVGFKYRVEQGWLCTADDSGHNQGYEAGVMAHEILANGADPASLAPRVPERGPLMVNRMRATMLGIAVKDSSGVEEYIEGTPVVK